MRLQLCTVDYRYLAVCLCRVFVSCSSVLPLIFFITLLWSYREASASPCLGGKAYNRIKDVAGREAHCFGRFCAVVARPILSPIVFLI